MDGFTTSAWRGLLFGYLKLCYWNATSNNVARELSLQGKTTNPAGTTHLVAAKPLSVLEPRAAFIPTRPRWEVEVKMPPPGLL